MKSEGIHDVNSKKLAGAGAAAIGAATAVTVLLLGSATASAEDTRPNSAYGVAAAGLLTINPVPYVESDGDVVTDELLALGEGGVSAKVLTVEAGDGAAESTVTELTVLDLIDADVVRTFCDTDGGGLQILGGTLLGQPLPEEPLEGQTIDASPLLTVTLGEQTRNDDGSLTVTGIEVSILPNPAANLDEELTPEERSSLPALGDMLGADIPADAATVGDVVEELSGAVGGGMNLSGALQTVTIGSATCAPGEKDDAPVDEPDDKDVPEAPKPEIVEADLPVTG